MVNYVDYKKYVASSLNLYNNLMHKRKSFEHEKEARAVFVQIFGHHVDIKMAGEYGVLVNVDVNNLIDEVYISPNSSSDFREIIEDLLRVYKIDAPVVQSGVNAPPAY